MTDKQILAIDNALCSFVNLYSKVNELRDYDSLHFKVTALANITDKLIWEGSDVEIEDIANSLKVIELLMYIHQELNSAEPLEDISKMLDEWRVSRNS